MEEYFTAEDAEDAERKSSERELMDDSFHAIDYASHVKIHEQAQVQLGQLQVGQELSGVNRFEPFDGFYFEDHGIVDHQIESKPTIDLRSLVNHR